MLPAPRTRAGLALEVSPSANISVSRADDAAEVAAERVAESVLRMPQPSGARPTRGLPRPRAPRSAVFADPGQPLDAASRAFFEPRFARDFADVRVHTGERAARSADALGADAYTHGTDIAFSAARFAPQTSPGRRLLAHELAHVAAGPPQTDRIFRQPAVVRGPSLLPNIDVVQMKAAGNWTVVTVDGQTIAQGVIPDSATFRLDSNANLDGLDILMVVGVGGSMMLTPDAARILRARTPHFRVRVFADREVVSESGKTALTTLTQEITDQTPDRPDTTHVTATQKPLAPPAKDEPSSPAAEDDSLDLGTAAVNFGETVAKGLLLIGVVGLFVGAEIITAGQATWLLAGVAAYGGVQSYLARRDEIESKGYDVPIPETMLASAGEIIGVSQLIEGISGTRLGTGEHLSGEQRSKLLGQGVGTVTLLLGGSRAYRAGQAVGAKSIAGVRGSVPAGLEGNSPKPKIDTVIEPARNPAPGPIEKAARESVPQADRVGFDRWMELIRTNKKVNVEQSLSRITPDRIKSVAREYAEKYRAARERADAAARSAGDPLDPQLKFRSRVGDVGLRYESRPPSAQDIAHAQAIHDATGEPVELFGDTPAGQDYPGIDGIIGKSPRPLQIKSVNAANFVRVNAADAFAAAKANGYSRVEVDINVIGRTVAEIRAAWDGPPANERGLGPVFGGDTISKITLRGTDGTFTIFPGADLPGVAVPSSRDRKRDARQ